MSENKIEKICKNCAHTDDNDMCCIIGLRVDKDASCSNFQVRMDMLRFELTTSPTTTNPYREMYTVKPPFVVGVEEINTLTEMEGVREEKYFLCTLCDYSNSGSDWNRKTREMVKDEHIQPIEERVGGNFYFCPHCESEVKDDEIIDL